MQLQEEEEFVRLPTGRKLKIKLISETTVEEFGISVHTDF